MLRFLTVVLLCLASAFAQDESKLLADLHKSFHPGRKKPLVVATCKDAVSACKDLDSQATAEALVDGWMIVDGEIDSIEAARQANNAEMAEIQRGQENSSQRTFPKDRLERLNVLKQQVQEQRDQIEILRDLQVVVTQRVQGLQRKDALLFFLQKVAGNKKYPLPIKLAALRAVGHGAADVMEELAAALSRTKDPEDLIVLLDAMALAGKTAQLHATPVIALLQHKDEAVRERAALALAKIAVAAGIEPMITLLGKSTGQTQLRIAAALEVLTGQQFGTNMGAWLGWWQAEGKAIASGDGLGKGTPSSRKETNKNYYFGIPQDQSNAILYVIDCSGSMAKEIALNTGATTAGGVPEKTSRLEGCKKELIRALGLLRPEQKFGVLWYNDAPHLWEPKMQPATKEATARAQAFVATLRSASTTNIYDSLQTCFLLVGRGVKDKYYGVDLDTIFLLTDGSPTRPDGKLDSTDKILEGVREWNPLKRVTIHTIGIGGELNSKFLGQLAKENGGEFKQF